MRCDNRIRTIANTADKVLKGGLRSDLSRCHINTLFALKLNHLERLGRRAHLGAQHSHDVCRFAYESRPSVFEYCCGTIFETHYASSKVVNIKT